ncbi:hypothetical protein [Carnobacterium mobile]|uniref:hypothetical protein n=1 Tax=Carnobacterium mobile TaxID=2750 RepID=UPI00054DDF56|nr:hypothetical protein [Carnobacterium mobile]
MKYTDKDLETFLFNFRYLKSEISEEGIMAPFKLEDTNTGGGRSGFVTNPTESVVMQLVDNETLANKIYFSIKITYANMSLDKRKVMEDFYFYREFGVKDNEIADKLKTDRSNLWRWRKEILKTFRNVLDKAIKE